jgi:hypothetical protein
MHRGRTQTAEVTAVSQMRVGQMMRRSRDQGVLAILVLCAGMAGCSGTGNFGGGYACPALAMAPPQLLYPIPGASEVPDAAGIFVFGANPSSPTAKTAVVLSGPGSATTTLGPLLTPVPTPLPSPTASPSWSTEEVTYVSHAALAANTTFSVSFKDTETGPCVIPIYGSYEFTTQ